MELSLKELREKSIQRAINCFKTYQNVPITYWTTALAGEVGEVCNMIKKIERVDHGGIDAGSSYTASSITDEMLKEEIGGIAIYLDLLASLLHISLEDAIIYTFNSKSEKYGFPYKLTSSPQSVKGLRFVSCGELFPDDWNEKIIRLKSTKKIIFEEHIKEAGPNEFILDNKDETEIPYWQCEWLCEDSPSDNREGAVAFAEWIHENWESTVNGKWWNAKGQNAKRLTSSELYDLYAQSLNKS